MRKRLKVERSPWLALEMKTDGETLWEAQSYKKRAAWEADLHVRAGGRGLRLILIFIYVRGEQCCTFFLWAGGGKVFVLYFDWGPVALHPAEKRPSGSRTESRWTGGDVCLHREASYKYTHDTVNTPTILHLFIFSLSIHVYISPYLSLSISMSIYIYS